MTVSKTELANILHATAPSHLWLQVNQVSDALLNTLWLLDLQQA